LCIHGITAGIPVISPQVAFFRRRGPMKTREYLAIKRRIDDFELAESLTRTKLIQGARAGNATALALLQERYNLRLPLVEDALRAQLVKPAGTRN
jgi:hypothetical protein